MATASPALTSAHEELQDLDSDIGLMKQKRKILFTKLVRVAAKEPEAAAALGIPTVMPVSNRGKKSAAPTE